MKWSDAEASPGLGHNIISIVVVAISFKIRCSAFCSLADEFCQWSLRHFANKRYLNDIF